MTTTLYYQFGYYLRFPTIFLLCSPDFNFAILFSCRQELACHVSYRGQGVDHQN